MDPQVKPVTIALYLDSAELGVIEQYAKDPDIKGFTTNPTLMRKAKVTNYEAFVRRAAELAGDKPISFEVFSDDFEEMYKQAYLIGSWAPNIYAKIPVTNTKGDFSGRLIARLRLDGVRVNVTAVMTEKQVNNLLDYMIPGPPVIISMFAGRVADTGRDVSTVLGRGPLHRLRGDYQFLWASPRQVYDIILAQKLGFDIITLTPDLLAKRKLFGKPLAEYSRETVQMFYDDAVASGFKL